MCDRSSGERMRRGQPLPVTYPRLSLQVSQARSRPEISGNSVGVYGPLFTWLPGESEGLFSTQSQSAPGTTTFPGVNL